MYRYSQRSQQQLSTCHPALQSLFGTVIMYRDCTIVCGFRNRDDQDHLYQQKLSYVRWPGSKHNCMPSQAVDVYPYISGSVSYDKDQCLVFGGFVMGLASGLGIKIRWGGDWDGDHNLKEHSLQDLGHFELVV